MWKLTTSPRKAGKGKSSKKTEKAPADAALDINENSQNQSNTDDMSEESEVELATTPNENVRSSLKRKRQNPRQPNAGATLSAKRGRKWSTHTEKIVFREGDNEMEMEVCSKEQREKFPSPSEDEEDNADQWSDEEDEAEDQNGEDLINNNATPDNGCERARSMSTTPRQQDPLPDYFDEGPSMSSGKGANTAQPGFNQTVLLMQSYMIKRG